MDTFFSVGPDCIEEDYLGFLAKRVPADLREQLQIDAEPELALKPSLHIDDLIAPLQRHAFPRSKHWEIADLTSYIFLCYEAPPADATMEEDLYKVIYVVSLYLHSFVYSNGPEASGYLAALGMFVEVSCRIDFESRLQVCRFLAAMVRSISSVVKVQGRLGDEDTPSASIQLAIAAIVGGILCDIGILANEAMKAEGLSKHWAADSLRGGTAEWGIKTMITHLAELYGSHGRVREIADVLSLSEK